MIDELSLLREIRPDAPTPDPVTVIRARRALLRRALSGRRRRMLRLVVVGTAAAAMLVVVGIITPWGGGARPAIAAQLTAAHLAEHPEAGPDQYLHIKRVQRLWGYGKPAVVEPWTLEYWVPGDGSSDWVERSGEPGNLETNSFHDWGPRLYVEHAEDIPGLLGELRAYASQNEAGKGLHGIWTVAFWIVNDPVAPESFKTQVMKAISTLDGVRLADPHFASPGLSGRAIAIDEPFSVWFVVDPVSGAFRGLVGHPEKDQTWVGPEAPMWTLVFETTTVDNRP
ncbi:MAG: hypothetical protein ABW156_01330 [Jiangellaceae bacterium]